MVRVPPPRVTVSDRAGNPWHLCARLHVDLQRTASST